MVQKGVPDSGGSCTEGTVSHGFSLVCGIEEHIFTPEERMYTTTQSLDDIFKIEFVCLPINLFSGLHVSE